MANKSSAIRQPSQFEFYSAHNIFPSKVSLAEAAALEKYAAVRRSLYERHLHVPFGLLRGHEVLDLGCGTGDSALVLALLGARLTLVDADPRVFAPLDTAFASHGVSGQITQRVTSRAEDYAPARRFSLAMAEGYLFTCEGREDILRTMLGALEPDGLMSVSFPDEIGSFMEFLKKAAFLRACALRGIGDLFGDAAAETGEALLGRSEALLPNPRPFRLWLHDCICSPFLVLHYCWSAPAIMAATVPHGVAYYSSSPSILEADRLGWYKNVVDVPQWNALALKGYAERAADFVFGSPVHFKKAGLAARFAADTRGFLEKLSKWFDAPARTLPKPKASWFAALAGSDVPAATQKALKAYFAAFDATTWPDFRRALKPAQGVFDLWGKSYHYLVLRRAEHKRPSTRHRAKR
jgi:SAM-dependent methyltransferase